MEIEQMESGEGNLSDLDILNSADEPISTEVETDTPAETETPASDEVAEGESTEEKVGEESDDKTDEEKPEEKKDEQKSDEPEPVSVKSLRESIGKNPQLKAALEADPTLRNRLFANARRSEELTTYKESFATPELAKEARTAAEEFTTLETDLTSRTPKGFDGVLDRIAQLSAKRDASGEVLKDENGNPLSNGLLEQFFGHHRTAYFWPAIMQMAEQRGADDITEAAQMLMEFLGDTKDGQGVVRKNDDAESTLPSHVRERLAKLDSLERQQGTQTHEATQQFEQTVSTEAITSVRSMLEERVKRFAPALSPAIQKRITDDALAEINGVASKDAIYRSSFLNALRRANGSQEIKTQLVGKATTYARSVAGPIIQRLAKEFSEQAVTTNQAKVEKLDAQKAKANVKGAGGPSTPTRQGDLHSLIREGKQLSNSLFKRDLTDMEILNIEKTVDSFRRMSSDRKK